ncbi:MAG TPA: zinc ABC transporter substrate-binding protein [Aquiluna sp.]
MIKKLSRPFGLLVAAATAIALAGCTSPETTTEQNEAEAKPTIVATTNVWASVLSQVAGDHFDVVALIEDPAMDPHSYEASARDQLAVTEASMFVMNGGGYDDFALALASAAGIEAMNVYEIHESVHGDEEHDEDHHDEDHKDEDHADEHGDEHQDDEHSEEDHADEHSGEHGDEHHDEDHKDDDHEGHEHDHDGSDHIWYDFHVAKVMAGVFAAEMSKLQPENAGSFESNAAEFESAMESIETRVEALADSSIHYFEAHPLAALLFAELGFENLTPEGFAEAEEAELEPSVAIVAEAQELIRSGELSFLAVNDQVTSPTLESLRQLAETEGVPVLEFGELLPTGMSYQQWADSVLDLIESIS